VNAKAEDRNRTSIMIVSGIGHVLIIRTHGEMLHDTHRIKRLDDVLAPIMRQLSVADQNTEPPAGKYLRATSEMPLTAAAKPNRSSARFHRLPFSTKPPDSDLLGR
jgi:hypothetical protein